jgi:hypothetical protein
MYYKTIRFVFIIHHVLFWLWEIGGHPVTPVTRERNGAGRRSA